MPWVTAGGLWLAAGGGFGGRPGSCNERSRWGWVLAMTSVLAMRSVHAVISGQAVLGGRAVSGAHVGVVGGLSDRGATATMQTASKGRPRCMQRGRLRSSRLV